MSDEGHTSDRGAGTRPGGAQRGDDSGWRKRFGTSQRDSSDEDGLVDRVTERLAQQWALARAERRGSPPVIAGGQSNFSRAQVPWGLDLAAAWSWRLIVITVASLGLLWTMRYFAVITVPLAIALLLAAMGAPMVDGLRRIGLPRALGSLVVLVLGLTVVSLLLTLVGQQISQGATDLAESVVEGLERVRDWLRTGPLGITESQVDMALEDVQRAITDNAESEAILARASDVGVVLTHFVAGFFIVLLAWYFFMADGARIWAWLVRIAPRAAREHVDTSGRVAWISLTQFVRATVLIALADSIGVMIVAWILGVPFIMAIGVLVFLGAFVPMIGATIAGSVAVLVALVDQGPITALLMLGGVILVQQIEGNLLQPFLMGRFVSMHPLGVLLAIAAGVLVAGVAGALIAVPLAAAVNAVAQHLAAHTAVGHDDADDLLAAEQEREMGHPVADLSDAEVVDRHDHPDSPERRTRSQAHDRSDEAEVPSGE